MKKYLTLLLLLVSVCFYGQEEEKVIVIEGFYKVSLGGGGHALFPVVNNTVKGPINLEIEHYKIPHGFVNTARVRVKGKISRAKYNYDCYYVKNRIVVDEVTLIDTTILMEKFLKKHADEKKEVLNEGEERIEYFESEGFYNERYGELYYVELKDGEIADTLGICFEGRASRKHSEVYPDKYNADGVYIKGTGFKITGRSYGFPDLYDTQFNVCELKVIDTNYTFYNYQQERIKKHPDYFPYNGAKYNYPNVIDEGKKYIFKGDYTNNSIKYHVTFKVKRKGGVVSYTCIIKQDGKIITKIKDSSILDYREVIDSRFNKNKLGYSSKYYLQQSTRPDEYSFFDVMFFDKKKGDSSQTPILQTIQIRFGIDNGAENIKDIELTQVKK